MTQRTVQGVKESDAFHIFGPRSRMRTEGENWERVRGTTSSLTLLAAPGAVPALESLSQPHDTPKSGSSAT